jgi:hypothetical protein
VPFTAVIPSTATLNIHITNSYVNITVIVIVNSYKSITINNIEGIVNSQSEFQTGIAKQYCRIISSDANIGAMSSTLKQFRLRPIRGLPLTPEQAQLSDALFTEYCARPQHANRLTSQLIASLRAAANSVARHGNPPNPQARLAYRMHKKRRAKLLAIAIYGDPNAKTTAELIAEAERAKR